MILNLECFLDELHEEFPDLTRDSINKICKKGLFGIVKELKNGEDILIEMTNRDKSMIYTPRTPEKYEENLTINKYRRRIRKERKQALNTNT